MSESEMRRAWFRREGMLPTRRQGGRSCQGRRSCLDLEAGHGSIGIVGYGERRCDRVVPLTMEIVAADIDRIHFRIRDLDGFWDIHSRRGSTSSPVVVVVDPMNWRMTS